MRVNLLQFIFSGASLWRWNDKLRPVQMSEIEKQAHKMLLACVLCHENTVNMPAEEADQITARMIAGGLADYFYRLVITDIKPPVFYKIKQNPQHYRQLTEYVTGRLAPALSSLPDFWNFARQWYRDPAPCLERNILNAAHLYASQWEFRLIRPLNPFDEEMDGIAESFDMELARFHYLAGMPQLLDAEHPLSKFASLCGQLRFQIRWTQTTRMPATTVLGHMFMAAAVSYLYSLKLGFGSRRANNNFFSGLFHDFPEVLTRDIISPVKRSYEGLPELIREYEKEELQRRVLQPLCKGGMTALTKRMEWYLGLGCENEFAQCCRVGDEILNFETFHALDAYDQARFDPRDGQLVKTCDLLSAFLEAHNSIRNGLTSPQLAEGRARLKNELEKRDFEGRLELAPLLADFE